MGKKRMSYLDLYESQAERRNRMLVASMCATTWRDANAMKRGDAFKQPVVRDDSETCERVKRNGDRVKVRGGGFYAGWKQS